MTNMRAFLLLFLATCAFGSEPSDDIRKVVEDYIVGWREGDSELLSRVLELDHGYVIWVATDESGAPAVASMSFRDVVARNKAAGPSYGSEVELLSIDVTDDTVATAKGSPSCSTEAPTSTTSLSIESTSRGRS